MDEVEGNVAVKEEGEVWVHVAAGEVEGDDGFVPVDGLADSDFYFLPVPGACAVFADAENNCRTCHEGVFQGVVDRGPGLKIPVIDPGVEALFFKPFGDFEDYFLVFGVIADEYGMFLWGFLCHVF